MSQIKGKKEKCNTPEQTDTYYPWSNWTALIVPAQEPSQLAEQIPAPKLLVHVTKNDMVVSSTNELTR